MVIGGVRVAGRYVTAGVATALLLWGSVASAQNRPPSSSRPDAARPQATQPSPPAQPARPAPATPATPETTPAAGRSVPLTPGMSVQGRLSASDLKLDDESYYDTYTFEAVEGRQYRVLLASADFDAVLFVMGAVNGSEPKSWQSDDLREGITDSEVIFTAPTAGTYEILVNSYDGGETGRYRLALTWTDGSMRGSEEGNGDPRLGGGRRLDTRLDAPVRVVPTSN